MTTRLALLTLTVAALASTSLAAHSRPFDRLEARGDRIDARLDDRGERINDRLDGRAHHADALGRDHLADHLDARGDRIEDRLDRRGDRIERRLDRRGR